jgi:hypothetical protein
MGYTSTFLVPKQTGISAAEYRQRAKKILLEMGIIFDSGDDQLNQFGNGDNSASAFEGEEDFEDDCPFEYAVIFAGPQFTLIPDGYVGGVVCPKCGADVTGEWSAATTDENAERRMDDLREEQVSCPKCKGVFRLEELRAEGDVVKFYMTDRYVLFEESRRPKEEWVKEFSLRTGQEHELVEYGWT